MRTRTRLSAAGGALALATALIGASGLAPASATTAVPEVAPYFETTGAHTGNLNTAITSHGLSSFTAAFVLGRGCTPTWDDHSTLSTATAKNALVTGAKSRGAVPIIAFGGQSGKELASTCTTSSKLVTAYSSVITKFGATKVDFDIEGTALTKTAVNSYRFKAIKALEQKYPSLEVSVTVPVGPGGLDAKTVTLLKAAKTAGARVDVVNIMTMDYGGAVSDMGAAAVTSAEKTLPQIQTIWPSMTYGNLGITPMIGQNDSPGEIFTYDDSQTVLDFARANGVRRLAFWNLNRDQACAPASAPLSSCSKMNQQPLDYTDGFLQ